MWGNGRNDNAWTQTDRRERRKTTAAVLIFLVVVLSGLGLLAFGLLGS